MSLITEQQRLTDGERGVPLMRP